MPAIFRHRSAWRLALGLVACLGPASRGHAEAAAETSELASVQFSPLVVEGRDTDLVGAATSASQGIVGATELDTRPILRRGELLETVPGLVVTQHSGDGKANQYFLRGFNLDHGTDLALDVDDMPVNLRSHAHGQGYADLNFLIPELVRQIDYSKGPFFAEVGDFSSAGAAHFALFDALPHDFLIMEAGDGGYTRIAAGGTIRSAAAETTGAFEFTHDDGPWDLKEDANRANAVLRRHWAVGDADYRLTLMGYAGRWRSTDQIPLRAVAAGLIDRFGNIDPTDGGESQRASVSFDGGLHGADASTHISAYAIYYRLNLFSDFTYFLDDPVNGDQFNQRDRRWVFGGAIDHAWTKRWQRIVSTTTVGAQTRADLIGELGLFHTRARRILSTIRDDQVDEGSAGLFLKNETHWTDWLRTDAGLRLDGYRFNVTSDNPLNSGTRLADIPSPKLGLVIGPWRQTELYADIGDGFHSNDARGTTIRVDPTDPTTPVSRVTPLVRSRGAEVGVRTSAVPGLVSSVSLWVLDLDSELVFSGDQGDTEATGPTRRYGVEFANFYRATRWLALDADVSFTHARYRDVPPGRGAYIANSIGTVVSAGITVGESSGWYGSMRLRYFGPQPLDEDNSVRAPSSSTVNLLIGWRSARWVAALELLNAFDRANYDIAYDYTSRLPGEPAAGVDGIHFHPGEPRTIRASLTRRF